MGKVWNRENGLSPKELIVAVTGASGAVYARTLLRYLSRQGVEIHLIPSSAGRLVYQLEIGIPLEQDLPPTVRCYNEKDFFAPPASGSFSAHGMVIVPCTMGTLAAVANGLSLNLIHRAADVCLKERRPLVVVPRETPLNRVHLRNMLKLTEAGAILLPAMPGFYHRPLGIEDIARFIVARILDQLGFAQDLVPPWNPNPEILS
ncbi:MAG: UbiX family flavin prenyltransferase [Syntrophobacteraceae bacterium]|nr:UbiX family flavin prenyltransferase [Syntrophobacteraceae bacterium]